MKTITKTKTVFRVLRNDECVPDTEGYPLEVDERWQLYDLQNGDVIVEMEVHCVFTYKQANSQPVKEMAFKCQECAGMFKGVLQNVYADCPHCEKSVELLGDGRAVFDDLPF